MMEYISFFIFLVCAGKENYSNCSFLKGIKAKNGKMVFIEKPAGKAGWVVGRIVDSR